MSDMDTSKKDVICYIDSDKELSKEHLKILDEMKQFKDDILSKKIQWELQDIPQDLIGLFIKDYNTEMKDDNHNDKDNSVKHATEAMYEYLKQYATHNIMLRCLIGGDFKIKNAKEILLKQAQFRCIANIDNITPNICQKGLQLKVIYSLNSVSKNGNPIIYLKIPKIKPKSEDYFQIFSAFVFAAVKHIIYVTFSIFNIQICVSYDIGKSKKNCKKARMSNINMDI